MPHNMTVTLEDPLWDKMKQHKDVRWSVVMKEAVKEKMRALAVLEELAKKSSLSEKEIKAFALELGRKVNAR